MVEKFILSVCCKCYETCCTYLFRKDTPERDRRRKFCKEAIVIEKEVSLDELIGTDLTEIVEWLWFGHVGSE